MGTKNLHLPGNVTVQECLIFGVYAYLLIFVFKSILVLFEKAKMGEDVVLLNSYGFIFYKITRIGMVGKVYFLMYYG